MANLDDIEIPQAIQTLEDYDNQTQLATIESLIEHTEPKTEKAYISRMTTMVHLEEVANIKRLPCSNLKNVILVLHSRMDRTFKIQKEVIIIC